MRGDVEYPKNLISRRASSSQMAILYEAYWHMDFLSINGCGTRKNNHGYSFEVALVSSPIL